MTVQKNTDLLLAVGIVIFCRLAVRINFKSYWTLSFPSGGGSLYFMF